MARKVITVLTDDLDGGEADRTVEFALDGVNYTIDLSEVNAGKLRKVLDPYIAAGVREPRAKAVRREPVGHTTASMRAENAAIRAWATTNGHQVSERGRIPASVVSAYRSTH